MSKSPCHPTGINLLAQRLRLLSSGPLWSCKGRQKEENVFGHIGSLNDRSVHVGLKIPTSTTFGPDFKYQIAASGMEDWFPQTQIIYIIITCL